MENSKKIQIGVLALIGLLIALGAFGVFGDLFGGSDAEASTDANAPITTSVTGAEDPSETNSLTPPAEPAAPTGPTTSIEFEETEFDFGTVDAGEKVTHIYRFTNTGDEPLIISNAKGSCGCTVPEWPKEPVAPGSTSEIKVQFDSKNKNGKQSKRVTLTANTDPAQTFLTIKGEVKGKPKEAPAAAK